MGLIYGAFAALVVIHMLWVVVTWRLLRPLSPRFAVVSVVACVPAAIVVTVIVVAASGTQGGPLVAVMAVASAVYPSAAAWWATEPLVALETPAG